MPLEIDDVSIRIIGNNLKGLRFYDDARTLQQEIYLQSDNTLNIGVTGGGGGGGSGITTHAIDGTAHTSTLADVQAPQFLLLDGTREMAGALDMGGYAITDVGLVDGVDVSAHAARHGSSGGDAVDHDGLTNFVANEHINHTAVTLTAGDGLAGGGDISASRTFAVGAGDGIDVAADSVAVDVTDVIDTSYGLTESSNDIRVNLDAAGGLEFDSGAIRVKLPTNHGLSRDANGLALGTPATLTVSTTNAVTTTTHTHAITSSSSPGAAAQILASNVSGYLNLVRLGVATAPLYPLHVVGETYLGGNLTFSSAYQIATASGNLTIAPAADIILDPVGNDVLPNTNYDINLGTLGKKYLTLHCAELWVETLVAQDTIATIGGRILVGPTTVLTSDLNLFDTTIYVKHNQMASGDRVYLEADGKVEFMAITSGPSGTGPYTYTVTRNLDGTGANVWYAGDAMFNTGTTGDGFIDLYSIRGVKAATQYGPTIVGNVRNSATYNDWTECWAVGNLNGIYGYGVDTYGVGLGKYSAADYITIDPTNGIRFLDATDIVQAQLSASVWTMGRVAASYSNIQISAGVLSLRNNTTERIGLTAAGILTVKNSAGNAVFTFNASSGAEFTLPLTLATTGGIYQGTGTFASPTIGLKIWNDGGIGRIGGYNAGVLQWYASTDGKLYAGAGQVVLDSGGITIAGGSALGDFLNWVDGSGNTVSVIGSYTTSGYNYTEVVSNYVSPNYGFIRISANGASGAQGGYIDIVASATVPAIGMIVGGVTSMTLYSTGVTVTVPVQLSEYIYHTGDADTYQRYQTDRWTLSCGGVAMIDAVESTTDYVQVGANLGIGVTPSYPLHVAGEGYITGRITQYQTASVAKGILISGTEYYNEAYSSTDGILLIVGVNRTLNRQLWIGDSTNLGSSTSGFLRVLSGAFNSIDAVSGDGITRLNVNIATNDTNVSIGQNTWAAIPANKISVNGNASIGATYMNVAAPANGMLVEGRAGIGEASPAAKLDVYQGSTTGAIPVIQLHQADVDQPFIDFQGGTVYTGKTEANEYMMVKIGANTRYIRLHI